MRLACLVTLVLAAPLAAQATLIVPHQYATIQLAIDTAVNGDTVLVDSGIYRENLDVRGKDIAIRSIAGALATVVDGSGNLLPAVLFSPGSTRAALLTGFTITGGSNPGNTVDNTGGGIRLVGSSPTIRRCVIRNNSAGLYGGGIGGTDRGATVGSSPLVEHCVIADNVVNGATFASGGGIAMLGFGPTAPAGQAELRSCIFVNNTANTRGGAAFFSYNNHVTVDDCAFTGNRTLRTSSGLDGGAAIFMGLNSLCTITNNRIWGNTSASNGAGIKYFNNTGARIVNNTITANVGGGIAGFANTGVYGTGVSSDVANCIVFGNGPPELAFSGLDRNGAPPTANVTHSDVEGGFPGTGNINAAPLLANAASGNHRLLAGSPCVNAGDNAAPAVPAVDFEGDPRPQGGTVDIGADERTANPVILYADRSSVSVGTPADVRYSVAGGAVRSGSSFVVLFGVSGTEPGFDLLGLHLPLNIDFLTPLVSSIAGTLDGAGNGSSAFPFSAIALPPSLVGVSSSSAAAIVSPAALLTDFTNDENVVFVP